MILIKKAQDRILRRNCGVISFPKSGRTWLRSILDDLYIHPNFDHETATWHQKIPYEKDEIFQPVHKYKRTVFMVREPKDVLVSYYYHATKRFKFFEGTMDDFIMNSVWGFHKICAFNEKWLKYFKANSDPRYLILSYEHMHANTYSCISEAISHLGYKWVSSKDIQDAITKNTFEEMQKKEQYGSVQENKFLGNSLTVLNEKDNNALKVRKGKVDGYKDTLTKKQVQTCDNIFQEYENYWRIYNN